ncbi:MAG: glycosyltransferase family 61 protein, partial [Pseudomonadota bacterium]
MARAKSPLRRVLNARYLRWWALRLAVRVVPGLGRRLAFFPRAVGLVESADTVLVDEHRPIPAAWSPEEAAFLARARTRDETAPGYAPDRAITGDRLVLHTGAWIDLATGATLLPSQGATVMARGETANWNATRARWQASTQPLPGRATALVPTGNYFHQIVETGLRIAALMHRPEMAGRPVTLVHPPPGGEVARALLTVLATLPGLSLREMPAGALVAPDEVLTFFARTNNWEWPDLGPGEVSWLREAFATLYGSPEAPEACEPRLYLSRAGAKLRQFTNGAEIEALLRARGFASFEARDTNHAAQIARFAAARTIVSIHGAGLTNLIFAIPGARVIEIFPANHVKSTYWWMARRLGLRYRPVIGGAGSYHQHFA